MWVAPASIAATTVNSLRPAFAEPVLTQALINDSSPRRAINVADTTSPALATRPS